MSVGVPVAGYHMRVARDRKFQEIVLDQNYDDGDQIDRAVKELPQGDYWVQLAITDLLGDRSGWSKPKAYAIGGTERFNSVAFDVLFNIMRPDKPYVKTGTSRYRITGRSDPGLNITINDRKIRMDEDGYFSHEVRLKRYRRAPTMATGTSRNMMNRTMPMMMRVPATVPSSTAAMV